MKSFTVCVAIIIYSVILFCYTETDDKETIEITEDDEIPTFDDDEIPTFDESGTDLDPLEDDEVYTCASYCTYIILMYIYLPL